MSSYERKAKNILDRAGIKYIYQSPYIVPWRRFQPDFYFTIWWKKIVVEIDWEYHNTIKAKIYDLIRDINFYYHWIDEVYRLTPKMLKAWKLQQIIKNETIENVFWKITLLLFSVTTLLYFIVNIA